MNCLCNNERPFIAGPESDNLSAESFWPVGLAIGRTLPEAKNLLGCTNQRPFHQSQ